MKLFESKLPVLLIFVATFGFGACSSSTTEEAANDEATTETAEVPQEEEVWVELVKGSSKEGWTQLNGDATYEVENGVVTGTTKLGEPNSFLTTNKMYDDFILEYEVKVDPRMNSGVQIRSNSYEHDTTYVFTDAEGNTVEKTVESPRVHGYQVEIDPSERAYSGGIYDEARRGWLADLSENDEGRTAFKNNEWNKYRVEAKGDTIRTFVNGIMTAELVDDMTDSGFIGLQVHSTKIEDPMQVQWRNIRIQEL
ncbi:uncharacterized protein YcnI [Catalinimonas alkaloidigena]|uniref:3-keto-disaccharide hydrolase n=1 Tax=Catalinimonas alkaloidigena TaxID=1075417 RepID=UPI002405B361|nr:DUF1080 domain-containing protein [Catalinimonas alkaloidigena]MDF9796009.1 uncharacterized protein YcnI [Catalinimonas alkaloidigena]